MSTTLGEFKNRVGVVLQDPDQKTFTTALVEELTHAALTEVGRIAPEYFTEDIQPVAYQIAYPLRSADFASAPPEIEVMRVEVWDTSTLPDTFISKLQPAAHNTSGGQDSGWYVWNGSLYLPTRAVSGLIGFESQYVIRVWGFSPYAQPVVDDDVISVSSDVEQAMVWFIRLEAIDLLISSRDLYTQWQTRSGNTDVSLAGLYNQRSIAEQAWQRRSRAIQRLRSEV